MKLPLTLSLQLIRRTLLVSLCTLAISGCSNSTDSSTLGIVESIFTTGTSTSQTVQINAGQFNNIGWNSDDNGVSNIDELIAGASNPSGDDLLQPVKASLEILSMNNFRINWQTSSNAEFYRVLENSDGLSGFISISEDLDASTQFFDHSVVLFNRVNALYIIQACNTNGCVDSDSLMVTGSTDSTNKVGSNASLSGDGNNG